MYRQKNITYPICIEKCYVSVVNGSQPIEFSMSDVVVCATYPSWVWRAALMGGAKKSSDGMGGAKCAAVGWGGAES